MALRAHAYDRIAGAPAAGAFPLVLQYLVVVKKAPGYVCVSYTFWSIPVAV